ncbi:zinc finger protein 420-like [Lampris incognitus]|uniref:zinc finger protein 420-like n=1 Tax=Lampris incognitus TaxID=2546036 RepID=UPI0024B5A973|nr:zinc finger protein 420-like [Lampris incognitus]
MESSSVYMCFPCYREFNSLDEVLKHQLTCNAEVAGSTQIPSETTTTITVPVLQTQQQFLGHLLTPSGIVVAPQIQTKVLRSLSPRKAPVATKQAATGTRSSSSSDQPRILYQCGDCDELFKTLDLWQQHRREGSCLQSNSATTLEGDPRPEPETDQQPVPEVEAMLEPDPDEAGSPEHVEEVGQTTAEEEARSQSVEEPPAAMSVEPPTETSVEPPAETSVEPPTETSSAQSSDPPISERSAASTCEEPEDSSPSRRRGANKKSKPEPVLLCVDCGSSFGLVSELVAHRKSQHGLEEALHRCFVCGESFLNTTLFLYHRKQHRQKGEEKEMGEATMTSEEDSQIDTMEGQDATSSSSTSSFTKPEMFLCTQCGESFNSEEGLAIHRKSKHGLQEALHHCSQCGKDFMNTTQYLYHRRLHRSNPGTEAVDGAEVVVDGTTTPPEDTSQTTKRLLSPSSSSSELGCPQPKRSRIGNINLLKDNDKGTGSNKEESEGSTVIDSGPTNLPPPAKLLQDWARTPLPHVCPYCGKTFTRRVFLRTHVFSHTGEKLFTCKVCSKAFTNSQSLLRHSMIHTGDRPFNCDVCGKNFSQAATLKRHQHTHTSTQPRRKRGRKPVCSLDSEEATHLFPCPQCPSRFNSEDQLNHHKLLHTSHPFHCRMCGMTFKRRKELDMHSLTHQDKEPATCPHCSAQFVNQSVLDIHLQRCPTTDEEKNAGRGRGQGRGRSTGQIECDLCGHRCMTQEGLDLHRLSHTGQTPLKCPVISCRRRFACNTTLEQHVVSHIQGLPTKTKGRPRFCCQICHKEFAYTSTFNVHMRTHTDERPFECTTCGKRFRQLPHLQDHERIHSGLRPFCCWVCGKSFSVAARLTEHARTHSGEKPYPCPHCPSAFRSRSNLDKHLRLHGDLPPDAEKQAAEAAQAAQVQKVLEGAKVLTSLAATAEGETGTVQTIYVLQGDAGTETVMIPSDQFGAMEGSSQVVILPPSVLGGQAIAVPTISMDGSDITMVETNQSPHHALEFIVEETI